MSFYNIFGNEFDFNIHSSLYCHWLHALWYLQKISSDFASLELTSNLTNKDKLCIRMQNIEVIALIKVELSSSSQHINSLGPR